MCFDLDAGSILTETDFFAAVARVMRFPDYFGNNWDALDECLGDMEWLPSPGYVLFIHGAEGLWGRSARIAGSLLETWLFVSEEWSKEGVPFHLVFIW